MTVYGGIYEFTIGVNDLDTSIKFWESCGYAVGKKGFLNSDDANALYGVCSSLNSIHMVHQKADAGLVRLMQWDNPIGSGLHMAPLRTFGNRWSVHRTDNIFNAFVHGEVLRQQGKPINLVGPHYNLNLGKKLKDKRPFLDELSATAELLLFQPEAQLVIMSRMNFKVPKYGTINEDSPLRISEGCHMALVFHGKDKAIFNFYEDVIGLKRYRELSISYEPGYMPSDMFNLKPGETLTELNFDDQNADFEPEGHLPGRLRCFLINTSSDLEDQRDKTKPGNLGYSFYTFRTLDIQNMWDKIKASEATNQSKIYRDEFGDSSFYFLSPDGFSWVIKNL